MAKNEKTDPDRIGPSVKTTRLLPKNQGKFSNENSTTLESVASIIAKIVRTGKTIRCYQCFACKRYFPASRMTSALILCRDCLKQTQGKGRLARQNQIDRITNDIRIFLRGRLEAQ